MLRRLMGIAAVLCGVSLAADAGLLQAQGFVPGLRQGQRHNPASPLYVDMRPGGFARRAGVVGFRGGVSLSVGAPGFGFGFGSGLPVVGFSRVNCFPGCFGRLQSPCFTSPCFTGRFYTAPLVIPAEQIFGPGPVRRMLNAAAVPFNQPPLLAGNAAALQPNLAGPNLGVVDQPVEKRQPRVANGPARERALKFIEFAQARFGESEYRAAYDRYRKAADSAPDLVEAYLGQGQALVALGRYDLAAQSFKRAFNMHPQWADADFKLADLYADNRIARQAHLDALAAASEADPNSSDLMMLLGAQMYYDGQPQRSLKFFQQAKALKDQQAAAGEQQALPEEGDIVGPPQPAPPPAVAGEVAF